MICPDYKINRMSDTVKFNLPKVQLRVKTTANDTFQSEVNHNHCKEYTHSVWQERFKMKKEIQESYIRFRRRKKNNYIKQFSSTKKCIPNPQEKKMNTIELNNKPKQSEDRVNFILEATIKQSAQMHHRQAQLQTHCHFFQKLKENVGSPSKDILASSCKPHQAKGSILARHYSLYDTEMSSELKEQFQLKGTKCNGCTHNESKKLYTQIMKVKSRNKAKNVSGKSSTFKIDGWKPEKISRCVDYLECEHLEIDY